MPIYEYKCARCGAEFELLIRRDQVPACPECRSQEVAKRMSAPASTRSTQASCDGVCGSTPHSCGCGGRCRCR